MQYGSTAWADAVFSQAGAALLGPKYSIPADECLATLPMLTVLVRFWNSQCSIPGVLVRFIVRLVRKWLKKQARVPCKLLPCVPLENFEIMWNFSVF